MVELNRIYLHSHQKVMRWLKKKKKKKLWNIYKLAKDKSRILKRSQKIQKFLVTSKKDKKFAKTDRTPRHINILKIEFGFKATHLNRLSLKLLTISKIFLLHNIVSCNNFKSKRNNLSTYIISQMKKMKKSKLLTTEVCMRECQRRSE